MERAFADGEAGDWAPERIRRGDGREWNIAAMIAYWERRGWSDSAP